MNVLRTIVVALALLLLGAHLTRAGAPLALAAGVTVAALGLLFVRTRWSATAIRILLTLGALEWLRSLIVYSRQRSAAGQPWMRLAVILGGVAALTALAAWIHPSRPAARNGDPKAKVKTP